MTAPSQLSSLLSATGDVGYEWDLRADRMAWFGPIEKLFGVGVKPPSNSQDFYSIISADDRHLVFGGEEHVLDRQYRLNLPGGKTIWVQERGSVDNENGQSVRQRGILRLTEKPQESILRGRNVWPRQPDRLF